MGPAAASRSEDLDAAARERFEQAQGRVRQKDEERQAAAERTRRQQLQRVEQLIERAQKRSTAEDLTMREADRLARDLRAAIDAPPEADREVQQALVERLRAASAAWRRAFTISARWTSGSALPTPRSRRS